MEKIRVFNSDSPYNPQKLIKQNETASRESSEVINRFGPDAPKLLNRYACALEDVLLKQVQYSSDLEKQIESLKQEKDQMYKILNSEIALANYVSEFFGPNGKCPGGAIITWRLEGND